MTASVVLDAWALIAFLRDEPPAPRVKQAIEAGAVVSWINLGEVIYIEGRRHGVGRAEEIVDALAATLDARAGDRDAVREAARVKAEERLSYADSFAVATAEALELPLLTGDPEILDLRRQRLSVENLRPSR